MRYVTTNIRLPEDLWRALKAEAADRGKRLGEVIRERLAAAKSKARKAWRRRPRSLYGILQGVKVSDELIQEAKDSLFPPPKKFLG